MQQKDLNPIERKIEKNYGEMLRNFQMV